MAKLTMLQIVQRVLSRIDADNVTTIGETVESEQVSEIVKTVYEDIMTDFPWYHKRSVVSLEVTPTAHIMALPNEVAQVIEGSPIYYGTKEVYYIEPENMLYKLTNRDTSLSNVDSNGAINDTDPTYWSSYDDDNIVFDSYNGSLVSANTKVWVAVEPTTPSADTDVPDMPHNLHVALLFGALAEAVRTLKGDEVGARVYDRRFLRKKAQAKRWARRVGKERSPGRQVDYGRKNISWSNEISSDNIIEG